MKYQISKRILLLVALALLMFGVVSVDTGQTAQASTANVPVENVTGLIQLAALSHGDTQAPFGAIPPLARVQAAPFSSCSTSLPIISYLAPFGPILLHLYAHQYE